MPAQLPATSLLVPHLAVVAQYDSLERLYEALAMGSVRRMPEGGYVRVRPDVLAEREAEDFLEARRYLSWYGLKLLVTSAVDGPGVELVKCGHVKTTRNE